jgi:hypothetical protein
MDSLIAAVVNWNLSKGSGMKGVLHMTQEAAQAGAELIVLPEFVVLELLREIPSVPEEQTAIALAEHAMRWTEAFSNLARSTGAVIVAGSIFEETHGGIRNVAPVCFPDGLVRRVEKNRMTGYEAEVWGLTPGDSLLAFEGPPLGVAICYDVEFPEAVRAMAEAGAKVVCVPKGPVVLPGSGDREPGFRSAGFPSGDFEKGAGAGGFGGLVHSLSQPRALSRVGDPGRNRVERARLRLGRARLSDAGEVPENGRRAKLARPKTVSVAGPERDHLNVARACEIFDPP